MFYEEELQKIIVSKNKAFKVEKILGEKKQGRSTLVLVKWLGFFLFHIKIHEISPEAIQKSNGLKVTCQIQCGTIFIKAL